MLIIITLPGLGGPSSQANQPEWAGHSIAPDVEVISDISTRFDFRDAMHGSFVVTLAENEIRY